MTTNGPGRRQFVHFERRWLFTLLVPLLYNPTDPTTPGEPVPRTEVVELEFQLQQRFDGYTKSPEERPGVEGVWINPETGEQFADAHRSYQIVAERLPEHEAYFLALHAELCERLRQEDIFITRQEIELATQRQR